MTAPRGSQTSSSRRWRSHTADSVALPFIGLNVRRRSSDSTASVASSLSDVASDTHDVLLEPAATESEDGTRSPNSAAECDRQEDEADLSLTRESPEKRPLSSCRYCTTGAPAATTDCYFMSSVNYETISL